MRSAPLSFCHLCFSKRSCSGCRLLFRLSSTMQQACIGRKWALSCVAQCVSRWLHPWEDNMCCTQLNESSRPPGSSNKPVPWTLWVWQNSHRSWRRIQCAYVCLGYDWLWSCAFPIRFNCHSLLGSRTSSGLVWLIARSVGGPPRADWTDLNSLGNTDLELMDSCHYHPHPSPSTIFHLPAFDDISWPEREAAPGPCAAANRCCRKVSARSSWAHHHWILLRKREVFEIDWSMVNPGLPGH